MFDEAVHIERTSRIELWEVNVRRPLLGVTARKELFLQDRDSFGVEEVEESVTKPMVTLREPIFLASYQVIAFGVHRRLAEWAGRTTPRIRQNGCPKPPTEKKAILPWGIRMVGAAACWGTHPLPGMRLALQGKARQIPLRERRFQCGNQ